ncbi:MAG TPA: sigma factor-like helix-turn-helix DNA-binding protein [Solirubrobacterales bacterium]
MKPAELEEARLGFTQYLRRKGFSPQFIAQNGDDLFAKATLEYSRKIAEGAEIESPAAWLIFCATQRTKNLLTSEGRAPDLVSTERAPTLVDDRDQSPEDVALEEDRFRKVRHAVAELSEEERLVIERAYFEDLPVREIARKLSWHPSKAQHRHESARKHLFELLGVESLDELEVEIGLAAYLSFVGSGAAHLDVPAGLEAMIEAVGRMSGNAWARAQDLARRLPVGGSADSPAAAALQSGAGRAAGVCATAVVAACFASGVLGPGVGGLLKGTGQHSEAPAKTHRLGAAPHAESAAPPLHSAAPLIATRPSASQAGSRRQQQTEFKPRAASASTEHARKATEAVRSQSLEGASEPPPEEAASAPTESAPVAESSAPTSSGSGGSSSTSTPTQIANEQFGP